MSSQNKDPRTSLYLGNAKEALLRLAALDGQTQSAVVRRLIFREDRREFGDEDEE